MPFYPPEMRGGNWGVPKESWLSSLIGAFSPTTQAMATGEHENQPIPRDLWMRDAIGGLSPAPLAMTRILRGAGGRNLIESLHPETGVKRGALGYLDNGPQVGFTNIHSSDPRGTLEMLNTLQRELGPRMNDMRIRTEIMPQSASLFGKMADRWSTKYPDLSDRIRKAVEMSQGGAW